MSLVITILLRGLTLFFTNSTQRYLFDLLVMEYFIHTPIYSFVSLIDYMDGGTCNENAFRGLIFLRNLHKYLFDY